MGPYDYTIYSFIKRNARVYGDRVALISGNQRITHKEFLATIDRLAFGLSRTGLEKGDRVGILAQNSLEYIYLYGAVAKTGGIVLPINWRLSSKEIEYIISDGKPKVLFISPEFQDMVTPEISRRDFIKKTYILGQADNLSDVFNDQMDNEKICPDVHIHPDDDYVIIYTAAVQGRPKGAVLTHQNLIVSNVQFMYYWALTKEDVHLLTLPLFHIAGLGMVLNIMQAGGSTIIIPKFDADLAVKHIQQDRVTIFGEYPPMLKVLLEKAEEGNYDLSSLRHVIGLDHPDIVKKFEEMSGATFWVSYAQSETSGIVSIAPYFERPGSAGIPSFLAEVEIMDEHGKVQGTGKSGEIVVRGPIVFKGYWNLEKDTEYTFRDGWHHTGDLGYLDESAFLWYKRRKPEKELIKSGGENVYPTEVEKVILEHPMVEEGVVIGVNDPQWGEAIKAVCVLKKGESLDEHDLIEFVAARIARYKKPKYVVFVSSLPKDEDGFIDREKVKSRYG